VRLGAQMAADAVNAAGGIKSLGGARIELILATPRRRPTSRGRGRAPDQCGAQILMGTFNSGDTAAVVPWPAARVPFLVDISAADPITANVAKSVRDGQQKGPVRYRNFPRHALRQRAVPVLHEISRRRRSRQRVVVMHANTLRPEPGSGFQAAHKARIRRGDRRSHLVARAAV